MHALAECFHDVQQKGLVHRYADYDSSGLPSFIEEPIRRLIQQQLEIYAADKTVRSLDFQAMTI